MMTTNKRPKGFVFPFLKSIKEVFPKCYYYERKEFKIKDVIEWGKAEEFTDLLVIYEKSGTPHTLIHTHLPEGPTATYRISSIKMRHEIAGHGNPTDHDPELILNNFDTMIGHRLGRMLASLFP
jgi:ribosome production factor 1